MPPKSTSCSWFASSSPYPQHNVASPCFLSLYVLIWGKSSSIFLLYSSLWHTFTFHILLTFGKCFPPHFVLSLLSQSCAVFTSVYIFSFQLSCILLLVLLHLFPVFVSFGLYNSFYLCFNISIFDLFFPTTPSPVFLTSWFLIHLLECLHSFKHSMLSIVCYLLDLVLSNVAKNRLPFPHSNVYVFFSSSSFFFVYFIYYV